MKSNFANLQKDLADILLQNVSNSTCMIIELKIKPIQDWYMIAKKCGAIYLSSMRAEIDFQTVYTKKFSLTKQNMTLCSSAIS